MPNFRPDPKLFLHIVENLCLEHRDLLKVVSLKNILSNRQTSKQTNINGYHVIGQEAEASLSHCVVPGQLI